MAGPMCPEGMPNHADFVHGVTSTRDYLHPLHHGRAVLMVTSGRPISAAQAMCWA